jgi:carboxypeptidase T
MSTKDIFLCVLSASIGLLAGPSPLAATIGPRYHTYDEVVAELDSIAYEYPHIARRDSIGVSTTDSLTIWALKISDNVSLEEDEPAILYTGVHHAEEILGCEICMFMIDRLVSSYGADSQATLWVDSLETWFVPIVNPDGHGIVMEEVDTTWRKNIRDNNGNGIFDPDSDGVDLNRNYDWYWETGNDTCTSPYYRGPAPFSEGGTQAIQDVALREKFVFAVNYHSPTYSQGELIYYPWFLDGRPAPDFNTISQVAETMASLIVNDAGDTTYEAWIGYGDRGYSRNWLYGAQGTLSFCVEVCNQCLIPDSLVDDVCERNVLGASYLLDRLQGPGITGRVTDSETSAPLVAQVEVVLPNNDDVEPRTTDATYGRYRRILVPGTYTVIVSKEGYATETFTGVSVSGDEWTVLDVELTPGGGIEKDILPATYERTDLALCYPNPFSGSTTLRYRVAGSDDGTEQRMKTTLNVYDRSGRMVRTLVDGYRPPGSYPIHWDGRGDDGRRIPSGVYLCRLVAGSHEETIKMVLLAH